MVVVLAEPRCTSTVFTLISKQPVGDARGDGSQFAPAFLFCHAFHKLIFCHLSIVQVSSVGGLFCPLSCAAMLPWPREEWEEPQAPAQNQVRGPAAGPLDVLPSRAPPGPGWDRPPGNQNSVPYPASAAVSRSPGRGLWLGPQWALGPGPPGAFLARLNAPSPSRFAFQTPMPSPNPTPHAPRRPPTACRGQGQVAAGPGTAELVTWHPAASGDRPSQTPSP
ncbi:hypothetical protein J1605_011822 [Eschrichtius robustus]|uniref:Uncharacterized protein n=1 Tax=Eschrichtius robustus TaxID=9764 RepID=A0AB34GLD9_ESCRO|nr:hypothetical protein J1605_011822 [Eschrichtius robustus]